MTNDQCATSPVSLLICPSFLPLLLPSLLLHPPHSIIQPDPPIVPLAEKDHAHPIDERSEIWHAHPACSCPEPLTRECDFGKGCDATFIEKP